MANRPVIKSTATSLFVQTGPGTEPIYLGDNDERCINLADLNSPEGARTAIHCQDGQDGYKVVGESKSPPDLISFNLENLLKPSANYMEKLRNRNCDFVFHVLERCGGSAGIFSNWIRAFGVDNCHITDSTLSNVAQRDADDPLTLSFDVDGRPPRYDSWEIEGAQKLTAETQDAHSIHAFVIENCGDACGPPSEICDRLSVAYQCDTGVAVANIEYSTDGGNTWAAPANLPSAVNTEDLTSVRMFQVGANTIRTIVGRSTNAGVPCWTYYSDDFGVTAWTSVVLGATNGEFIEADQGIMALDENNIWVVTDQGNVYFSSDAGATFAVQASGLVASGGNDLMAVDFVDSDIGVAVGDADTVIYTLDGGTNWVAATATGGGNNLQTVQVFSRYRWIVGDDGGEVYQTFDGGVTWTQMTSWTGSATGTVTNIKFLNGLIGFMVHTDAATDGRILKTLDGGYSWVRIGGFVASTAGLNAVHPCSINHAFAVGDDDGTRAVIVEAGD